MGIYEKLKGFLGIPSRDSHENRGGPDDFYSKMFGVPARSNRIEEEPPCRQGRSFDMHTDMMEMHRYFEQQIDGLLRNFGFDGGFNGGFFYPGMPEIEGHESNVPELPDAPEQPDNSGNLRDQYLKPGYERRDERHGEKMDRDLDGKLDMGDVFSIFDGDKRDRQITPYEHRQPQIHTQFFSKSSSIRTVVNPDGSTETHRTVRDHEGNEETTVTRQMGDKEYTIIKRKDRNGREETVENLVNLDENEAKALKPSMPRDGSSWIRFWKF